MSSEEFEVNHDGEKFVPLHCHSYYSMLDGLDSPKAVADRAAAIGHKSVALTDHGTCSGLYTFQKACKDAGVKPILGMEGYMVDKVDERNKDERKFHVTLWAKGADGYKSLIKLSSLAHIRGFYSKPRFSIDQLAAHKNGLMVGSACIKGIACHEIVSGRPEEAERRMRQMAEIFGTDFYFELMVHKYVASRFDFQEKQMAAMKRGIEIADKIGVKSVYTYDSHYCRPEDAEAHDVLICMQRNDTIKNPAKTTFGSSDFYMKTMGDIMAVVKHRPDLVENTLEVAEKVESGAIAETPFRDNLPAFDLPPGVAGEEQYLKTLIREGMMRRGVFNKQEYRERILKELDVITKCGFVRYFLVLWDIVDYAKRSGIKVGPGRGSGAASLCLYCLGITHLDPLVHDLMFERFLNAERISPPDVDMDFDDSRQHEMFAYISRKYGSEKVARIGTHGTLGARAAIRNVGKVLDIGGDWTGENAGKKKWESGPQTLRAIDEIAKCVPDVPDITIAQALKESPELRNHASRHEELFRMAQRLEGIPSHEGIHAAGVVVANKDINGIMPLRIARSRNAVSANGDTCTEYDMEEVEALGLLKYDLLGLRNLRVEELCLGLIRQRSGDVPDLNAIPLDDKRTFKTLQNRMVDGIFQFEGNGISELLCSIEVDSFEDMVAGVALFRPGTLSVRAEYVERKHGRSLVTYAHPKMDDFLKSTYGIMVYQEQVMQMAIRLAGFSGGGADTLRKAMGKKKADVMEKQRQKFVDGCVKTSGMDAATAGGIFENISQFAGYGFNRAHAASYALLAYQNAWLKTHYPIEFMCALLSANADKDDKIRRYERACSSMGIDILGVHINKSGIAYAIEGGGLRRPIVVLKGVGSVAASEIVKNQPFKDLNDFLSKVGGQAVDRRTFALLAEAESMNCFEMSKKDLIGSYESGRELAKKKKIEHKKYEAFGGTDLFGCAV